MLIAPARFGDGERLAGGWTRFAAIRLTIDGRDRVVPLGAVRSAVATLPAAVRARVAALCDALVAPRPPLAGLDLARPHVMGILNVTPDSFSDGGRHPDPVAAAHAMVVAGAGIVDIGGESTRPGASDVAAADELARVAPVFAGLRGSGIVTSIDSRKASVMAAALDAGAGIVNDVSALTFDAAAMALVAARGAPIVLMHAQGTPATMQVAPAYDDVVADVFDWLEARIAACVAAGIARHRIVADPGIGFGKTAAHNAALLRGIGAFHALGVPLLLGASRKAVIARLAGDGAPVDARLGGSLALALHGVAHGVQIVRVHDVPETVQAMRVAIAVG